MIAKNFESEKEAIHAARNAIENASSQGPWMVAVFSVMNGELISNKLTWDFPKAKMVDALSSLDKLIREETGGVVEQAPLPRVDLAVAAAEEQTPMPVLVESPIDNGFASFETQPHVEGIKQPTTPDDLGGEVIMGKIPETN